MSFLWLLVSRFLLFQALDLDVLLCRSAGVNAHARLATRRE
jgi:hypothetical protein